MKIDFDGSVQAVDLDGAMTAVKDMSAQQFNTTSDQIQVKSLVKVRKRRT